MNSARLKKMIRSTLDQYLAEDRVPARTIHNEAKQRHGDDYRTSVTICACIANEQS